MPYAAIALSTAIRFRDDSGKLAVDADNLATAPG